jgi:hypothetical protein
MTAAAAETLSKSAQRTAVLSREAYDWINRPANASRVGDPTTLGFALRQASLRARRIARAATRKMCVGVFGPSQAGKSYLVSVLSSPDGVPLQTKLDAKVYDFQKDINPPGGRESTGLVTRMTTDAFDAPAGFPVSLRLLSQIDLVKVLANSFYLDFDLEHFNEVPQPGAEAIEQRLMDLRSRARPGATDRLIPEDVFDLREYMAELAPKRGAIFGRDFWNEVIDLAPHLEGADRARLWSLLWYDYQPFTKLFADLYEGLRAVGFAEQVYAELGALSPRNTSIIDVMTLDRLGVETADEVRVMPTGGTAAVGVPRALLAALTAELRISVHQGTSTMFRHTDILDFPGARTRLGIRHLEDAAKDKDGKSTGASPLRELFLRGKVAYLFEGYTADKEITALLLCIPDSVQDTGGLAATVDKWIAGTLGETPQKREKEKCSLFLVLTKMDREFAVKGGLEDSQKDWSIRIHSSLLNNFRSDWPKNWDGRPFANLFWLRNPTAHEMPVMTYDTLKREVDLTEEMRKRIPDLRTAFLRDEVVRRHFRQPEEAWAEALRANDGGVSYIVRSLEPVCEPGTKLAQLRGRLSALRSDLVRDLERFHVSGDHQVRLAKRREVGDRIMDRLYDSASAVRLGTLLRSLQIDAGDLEAHLYRAFFHAASVASVPAEDGTPAAPAAPILSPPARIGRARPGRPQPHEGGQAPAAPAPLRARTTWEERAAQEVMRCWEGTMAQAADRGELVDDVGLERDLMKEVAAELLTLAHRNGLERTIAKAIGDLSHIEHGEQRVAKATMIGQRLVNRFVSVMDFNSVALEQRPTVTVGEQSRPVFRSRAVHYGTEGWSAESARYFEDFFDDWANGFYRVVEDNAKSLAGLSLDIEQNEILGKMLDDLRSPV